MVEHVLERLQPRREQLTYRVAALRDRVGEFASTPVEHLLEGLQARREHFTRRVAAAGNDVGERLGGLAELVGHPAAALYDRIGDARARLLELGHHVSAAQAQIEHK